MKFLRLVISALALVCAQASFASTVSPGGSGSTGILTDLGSFAAGTYQITATGIVDLVGNGSFRMTPDGLPETTVTSPNYPYFNPSGSYLADGNYGAAGTNALIGALIGTLTSTPSSASDWFLIGSSKLLTLVTAGHIYASVNDTYHNNNTGAFNVSVTAVPEPGTYALLLAGLGLMGTITLRRRRD